MHEPWSHFPDNYRESMIIEARHRCDIMHVINANRHTPEMAEEYYQKEFLKIYNKYPSTDELLEIFQYNDQKSED